MPFQYNEKGLSMATVVKAKRPITPGTRHVIDVKTTNLHKGRPYSPLVEILTKKGGRNNQGRITMRHRGGGHKQYYRIVDFKRDKDGIPAVVERLEYDPNRSAHIALVLYKDGERRYIIAPRGLDVNAEIISGADAPIKVGNTLPLSAIPVGSTVHCVELKPGAGAQMGRSAGAAIQLISKEGAHANIRLRSGEVRRVLSDCRATIGEVGHSEKNLRHLGKAGKSRHFGIRPHVRGVAMNPVDHPHGGGEGKTSGGRHPVSPTGVKAKGFRTRKNKRTDQYVIRDRRQK